MSVFVGSPIGFRKNGQPIYLVRGGSEYATEQPTQGSPDLGGGNTGGQNPAWSSYLTDLPDSVRPLVEPKFKEWDANVQKLVGKVHSQYEPYKAYQPLIDAEYDPNDVMQAVQFAQLLNEDPQKVIDALQAQFGGQGQPDTGYAGTNEFAAPTPEATSPFDNPELARYRDMTEQMAQILVSQQQAQQQQQEDAALESHVQALKQQHGEFDEDYVLTKVYAGADWNTAIAAYQNIAGKPAQPNAPVVMGSGGGLPSQTVNPAQMSDRDRKALVAQLIAQHQQTT